MNLRLPVFVCTLGTTLLAAGAARAEPPEAQTGFQAALRQGVAIPFGSVSSGVPMSDAYTVQGSATLDAGLKPIENLFVGGYFGLGLGGAGSALSSVCDRPGASCGSATVRFGIQAQLHLRPSRLVNPWLGYGIGLESTTSKQELGAVSSSQNRSGIELAHVMAGVDFRVSQYIGVGPYLDLSITKYGSASSTTAGQASSSSEDIENRTFHEWFTLGVKITFLP